MKMSETTAHEKMVYIKTQLPNHLSISRKNLKSRNILLGTGLFDI